MTKITTIETALRKHWGYSSFRPFQKEAVDSVLSGRDCLVILPTGGGKSLCYQLPAALGEGLVVVISPLIALMDDQVSAAREAGLAAGALHSNLDPASRRETYRDIASGKINLLYVSPERLLAGDLFEFCAKPSFFAVDEAHCVSHWGHDFRPEYRRISEVLDRFPDAPRMALTATATPAVQEDIKTQLGLREPACFVGHPDRANLIYRAMPRRDQLGQTLEVINRHQGEGGIVYAQTRKEVERLAASLKKEGISCAPYHAGLSPEERRSAQDGFIREEIAVIVATIAFGMGIDRSNVRFVVHANTPRSVEHYQQESGRAGRDGLPAECMLLFAASDLVLHRRLAGMDATITPERHRAIERQLRDIGGYAVAPVCRHRMLTEHFGAVYDSKTPAGCGACDVCLGETKSLLPDEAVLTAKKVLSAAWRTEGRFGSGYVIHLLLGKTDERMERNGHDKLKVFGLLKEAGEHTIRSWVDQLIVQNFLAITDEDNYPLLSITEEGRALCRDERSVRLGVPVIVDRKRKKKAKALAKSAAAGLIPDEQLFEQLRQLRKLLADKLAIPPFHVFHDTALAEMAALKPATPDALREVKGIGDYKLEKYGAVFLRVIAGEAPETVAELF